MTTFGRQILGLAPNAVLDAEREAGVTTPFPKMDEITAKLAIAAFNGARVAVIEKRERSADVELPLLTGGERDAVAAVFKLGAQQARGAWFLPDRAPIRMGSANLPYHFHTYARFAATAVADERENVIFGDNPNALYFWAVLEPLFSDLVAPVLLRGSSMPTGDAKEQRAVWAAVDALYGALGIDGGEPLRTIRYGGGWSRLRSDQQLATKQALIEQVRHSITHTIASRYRAFTTAALVEKYYAKMKKSPPLMRQVLTKPLQRTLSAFFGGDWLALMQYLGEQPNPNEQLAAALPEPRLYVDTARATAAAAAKGIPAEEIERIIAAYWTSERAESPIHKRIDVLRQCWHAFSATHAAQTSGMPSLWGLVEYHEDADFERDGDADPRLYNRGVYRKVLPQPLLATIRELWSGAFLRAYPDAIITAVDPYARMCDALGPALRFWDGLALTAWFVAEGPSSRTDMQGAEHYYERDLTALEAIGCPVDRQTFADLIATEKKLGKPQPIEDDVKKYSVGGITLRVSMSTGYRLRGFERLRDVVTQHRRVWTEQHLEPYLRALWETELKKTAREYNRLFEVKRKLPTIKQFARYAESPTNRWFGGDVSQLYRALGEKSPLAPVRRRFLYEPPTAFARRVFAAIGGTPTTWEDLAKRIVGDRARQDAAWRAHQNRVTLATKSLHYVQMREGLDRPPTLKEFGPSSFAYMAPVLDDSLYATWGLGSEQDLYVARNDMKNRLADVQPAWERYSRAVETCIRAQLPR